MTMVESASRVEEAVDQIVAQVTDDQDHFRVDALTQLLQCDMRALLEADVWQTVFAVQEVAGLLPDEGIIHVGFDLVVGRDQAPDVWDLEYWARGWRVGPTRVTTIRVPPTLTGVLQARLDSLPTQTLYHIPRGPRSATTTSTS